jgi:hypothetical protein
MLSVIYAECLNLTNYAECRYAECRYAECRYAECRSAECRYAECRYAECRSAECRGALFSKYRISSHLWNKFGQIGALLSKLCC